MLTRNTETMSSEFVIGNVLPPTWSEVEMPLRTTPAPLTHAKRLHPRGLRLISLEKHKLFTSAMSDSVGGREAEPLGRSH